MTWIDILERTNFKTASQESTIKSSYELLEELERIIEIKTRNTNNENLKDFHNNRLEQMRRVFLKMIDSIAGTVTEFELSNLIYNYNRLEKKARLI